MCHYQLFSFRCGHMSASRKPVGKMCEHQRQILKSGGYLDAPPLPQSPSSTSSSFPPHSSSPIGAPYSKKTIPPRCPDATSNIASTFKIQRPCPSCSSQTGSYVVQCGRRNKSVGLRLPVKIPADSIIIPSSPSTRTDAAASKKYLLNVTLRTYSEVASRKQKELSSPTQDISDQLLMMRLRDEDETTISTAHRASSDSDSGYAESFLTSNRDKDGGSVRTAISIILSDNASIISETLSYRRRTRDSVDSGLHMEPGFDSAVATTKTDGNNSPNSPSWQADPEKPTSGIKWARFTEWRDKVTFTKNVRKEQSWKTLEMPRQFKLPLLVDPTTMPDFGWINEDGKWVVTGISEGRTEDYLQINPYL